MRAIVSFVANLIAAVAVLTGLLALGYAFAFPYAIDLNDASAFQMTQIYTMATHYAVLGIGLFVFAGVCIVGGRQGE